MSKIILLADGAAFNSRLLEKKPLGGAETACIRFAESLARRGYEMHLYTTSEETYRENGVYWYPLNTFSRQKAAIVIAHRTPKLLSLYPVDAPRKILYVHNPTHYLRKLKHRIYLYKHSPDIIFSGHYHASTWPRFLPKTAHLIIPYAVDNLFLHETPRLTPKPRAIFTSNPLRSLDWLLEVWSDLIYPACPDAELHLYCGPDVYPNLKPEKAAQMRAVLDRAKQLSHQGLVIHDPLPKRLLAEEIKKARVMLYRGDPGESFCLALAEAQALGVPAVTQDIGSCAERLIDGKTGFVTESKTAFAQRALALLTDERLWQQQHLTALATQTEYTWDHAAQLFD